MKKRSFVFRAIFVCIVLWVVASFVKSIMPVKFPKIVRRPKVTNVKKKTMMSLPKYDPNSFKLFQVDLQGRDLSKLDLRDSENDLMHAKFDTTTVWPSRERLPQDFDWEKIIEMGKNPGLGIRDLHKQGITGRGVGIAIIDNPLLVDHKEYADRLRLYEEDLEILGCIPLRSKAHMHGPAVASIAVGRNVGVAPEADLYYIARWVFDTGAIGIIKGLIKRKAQICLKRDAQAIYRILKINKQLPKDRKIRVISISMGWWPGVGGYKEINKAVQRAKNEGILVLCSTMEENYSFDFHGLGRFPLADPDNYNSYEPGVFMKRAFYRSFGYSDSLLDGLLVPMGSRTIASNKGIDDYSFGREGGRSWAIPYVAGTYALAAQVDPNITPKRFWALAIKTGNIGHFGNNNYKIPFGWILNPKQLIDAIKAGELSDKNDLTIELERQQTSNRLTETDLAFRKSINDKVSQLDLQFATRQNIIDIFSKPLFYQWGRQMPAENNLPDKYLMFYPNGFKVFIVKDNVERLEFYRPGYIFENSVQIGSPLERVIEAMGQPMKTVKRKELQEFKAFQDGILYTDVFGNSDWCYYAPKGRGLRIYFKDNKVNALYLTKRK